MEKIKNYAIACNEIGFTDEEVLEKINPIFDNYDGSFFIPPGPTNSNDDYPYNMYIIGLKQEGAITFLRMKYGNWPHMYDEDTKEEIVGHDLFVLSGMTEKSAKKFYKKAESIIGEYITNTNIPKDKKK